MKLQKRSRKKPLLIAALVAAILVGGSVFAYLAWDRPNGDNLPISDPNFTGGTERDVFQSPVRDGGVRDTSEGEADRPLDTSGQSNWLKSDSGQITLIEPRSNTTFESGSRISGLAEVDRINYRLTDDVIGVVGTGSIGVVNGRFSGVFEFKSNGAEGRLDIFSTLEDGTEVDIIEVPVKLK